MTKSPSAPAICSPCPPRLAERRGRLAAATGLCSLLTACSLVTGPNDLDNLDAARTRWNDAGPRDYSYDVRWACFCGGPVGRWIRVTVVDGAVVEGRYLDTDNIVEFRYWKDLPTVPDLFDLVEGILGESPDRFDVLYNRDDGHPILLVVDRLENAVDDEYTLQSKNLQGLTNLLLAR